MENVHYLANNLSIFSSAFRRLRSVIYEDG